ncbi:MAG: DJ-1/PfpI family protein [Muribaculaceae bacterium]|nr:DJ-1/PfpI family protein [Muribaculaceae bacterium]
MRTSYIFLAEGFEEIEALTVVDVLRRAGIDVKTVSITPLHNVRGAHGIEVNVDCLFADTDFSDAEWLICPGGLPGSTNLADFEPLGQLLKAHNRGIAAICAAPGVVLAPLGLLDGKEATCYPGFEEACTLGGASMRKGSGVVAVDNLITGAGPALALPFGLAIVAATVGEEAAEKVAAGMLTRF